MADVMRITGKTAQNATRIASNTHSHWHSARKSHISIKQNDIEMILPLSANQVVSFTVVPPNSPAFAVPKKSGAPSASPALLAAGVALAPSHFNWSNVYDFRHSLMQLHQSRKIRRYPRQKSTVEAKVGSGQSILSSDEKPFGQGFIEGRSNGGVTSNDTNATVFSASAFTFYDSQLPSTAEERADYDHPSTKLGSNFRVNDNQPKFYKMNKGAHELSASVEQLLDDPVSMKIIAVIESANQPFPTRPPMHWDSSAVSKAAIKSDRSVGGHRASAVTTQAAAGLAVFMFSLMAVIFIFLLFYLISRFFRHTMSLGHASAGRFDTATRSSIIDDDFSSGNYTSRRKFNLLARNFANEPQSILYPKRIYELKAEEGCLTGPMGFPIPVGLSALNHPFYLVNSSGYEEQNCWMNTILLTESNTSSSANNSAQKKKSTASMVSQAKPEMLKNLAKSCGKSIVRKLTGIDNPLSKEKLRRIHQLRNEKHSCA